MTWNELTQTNNYRYLWTGAANFLTVTKIPELQSRILGFDEYTLIRLDWLGMLRLFGIGEYRNQARCLIDDCGNYAYYKPISITVELIPKLRRPPGKLTFVAPTSVTLPALKLFQGDSEGTSIGGIIFLGHWEILGWSGTIANGTALTLPQTNFLRGSSVATIGTSLSSVYDPDAATRVGYIIPASGNTAADPTEHMSSQLYADYWVEMYDSFFASAALVPNGDFTSAFRRAPYKRGRIVAGKKISFTFKMDSHRKAAGTPYPAVSTAPVDHEGVKYINDCYVLYNNHANNNPFDHYRDVRPDGWINANIQYWGIPRVNVANASPWATERFPFEAPLHQFQPMEFAQVFIPGISVATIFRFFDIRFKYKCVYRSKEFDLE